MNIAKHNTQSKKVRLFYIQPVLAGYRIPILRKLTNNFTTTVFFDNRASEKNGYMPITTCEFNAVHAPIFSIFKNHIFYQKNIIKQVIKKQPDSIISFANPRFISFWLLLITCKIFKIKLYAHGQGLYSHPKPSYLRSLIYRTICNLSTKYICYTEQSQKTLLSIGCKSRKLTTIQNSLELNTIVNPEDKSYKENGILFIGRLREDCRIDLLIKAIQLSRSDSNLIELHIIGGGQLEQHYRDIYNELPWIHWHGAIHDDYRIAEISRLCRIGCYPGDAGLSIVHMFGLGLPPLVHNQIEMHMGPEPSYIINNKNGFLFNRNHDAKALAIVLKNIWQQDANSLSSIGSAAFRTYKELNSPTMGEQFIDTLTTSK